MPTLQMILYVTAWAVPVILAITFHEAAHGYVAWMRGDDTAKRLGRITLNPLRHVDPFGTVIMPAILYLSSGFVFGYAKPVPVNFNRLDNPRRDMVWVAAAGPAINIALAFASALGFYLVPFLPRMAAQWLGFALQVSMEINVLLAVFNMIPLPPLDGGRVAVGLLPDWLAYPLAQTERYGMFVLIGLLVILPLIGKQLGVNLNVMGMLLGVPVDFVIEWLLRLAGHGA